MANHELPNHFSGERMTAGIIQGRLSAFCNYLRKPPAHLLTNLGGLLLSREHHLQRYRFVLKTEKLFGKNILDLACGEGYGCNLLDSGFPELLVGADISTPALKVAQSEYPGFAIWVAANGERLPFSRSSFDLVTCFETVEHIKDDEKFIQELQRVLTDDGLLIISTPNRNIFNPGTAIADQPKNEFHIREYTPDELKDLLTGYFAKVEFYGQDLKGIWRKTNPLKRKLIGLVKLLTVKATTKVKPLKENDQPVYLVAVCRGKKVN